jgi:hypothetical protein
MLVAVTGVWAYALTQLAALSSHPAELLAGVAVAATLFAIAVAVRLVGLPAGAAESARRAATVRGWTRRGGVPSQLAPDAAGRPRPRAPSAFPSAA